MPTILKVVWPNSILEGKTRFWSKALCSSFIDERNSPKCHHQKYMSYLKPQSPSTNIQLSNNNNPSAENLLAKHYSEFGQFLTVYRDGHQYSSRSHKSDLWWCHDMLWYKLLRMQKGDRSPPSSPPALQLWCKNCQSLLSEESSRYNNYIDYSFYQTLEFRQYMDLQILKLVSENS